LDANYTVVQLQNITRRMVLTSKKVEVQSINEEKDLGVYFSSNLKSSKQCVKSAARARSVLGLVRRHFRRLDIEDFLVIYIRHT